MAEMLFVAVAGPTPVRVALTAPGPFTIGRRTGHAVTLAGHEQVSRDHAELTYIPPRADEGPGAPGRWQITDTNSRHGTFVNGVRLAPWRACPIRDGDLVVVAPFSFRLIDTEAAAGGGNAANADGPATMGAFAPADLFSPDDPGSAVERFDEALAKRPQTVAQRRLGLLLECAAAIHQATDEREFAAAVVDAAARGAGFANAAFLKHFGDGNVEALASIGLAIEPGQTPRLSRSLIREAAMGRPARLTAGQGAGPLADAMSIVKLSIDEALCVPVIVGPVVAGFLYLDNRGADAMTIAASKAAASALGGKQGDDDSADFAIGLAKIAALALSNLMRQDVERRHADERQSLFMGAVEALVASIDAKDAYTRGHSERVAHLSARLGAAVGLDPETVERIRIAGLVHDVGKIGVPEAVLRKPSRLTEEEFALIKAHPATGRKILRDIPQLAAGMGGVLHHHEKFGGGGYPEGLAGEAIPIFGRIIGLADAFDAMSSSRAYRGALDRGHVLDEIRRSAGSHFDPALVGHFVSVDLKEYDRMVRALEAQG